MLELGCLFGALGAGVLADKVSRRSSIAFACGTYCIWVHVMNGLGWRRECRLLTWLVEAVFCIGSALQTWARSLTQITGGRAIGGLGVGALRYSLTCSLDVPSKTFDRPFWHFDDIVCSPPCTWQRSVLPKCEARCWPWNNFLLSSGA